MGAAVFLQKELVYQGRGDRRECTLPKVCSQMERSLLSLGGHMPMCSAMFSTGIINTINERTYLGIRRWSKGVGRRGRAANVSEAALEDKCWWLWVLCHFLLYVVNINKCEVFNHITLAECCVLVVQGCLMKSLR